MNIQDFMQGYKTAWEQRDPSRFAALFHPDGRCHNTPFQVQRGAERFVEYRTPRTKPRGSPPMRVDRVRIAATACWLTMVVSGAAAQTSPALAPMDPSAAHEKLRFFEGTWTTSDYSGFRSGGALIVQQGGEADGRWSFASDQGVAEARVRTRVTIEPAGANGFRLQGETSKGDGPWERGTEVLYRRLSQ